jgi:hypothetical protein
LNFASLAFGWRGKFDFFLAIGVDHAWLVPLMASPIFMGFEVHSCVAVRGAAFGDTSAAFCDTSAAFGDV